MYPCYSKRENCKLKDSSGQHLAIEFCNYPANMSIYIDYRHCSLEEENHNVGGGDKVPVCEKFSVSNLNPCFFPASMERARSGRKAPVNFPFLLHSTRKICKLQVTS